MLNYVYRNFVTWEPVDRRLFRKRVKLLTNRDEILKHDPYYLDPFDINSCVVGINLNSEDYNKIVIASNNVMSVFEADKTNINFITLHSILPRIVSKRHNQLVANFRQNQNSTFINHAIKLFALTAKGKLMSIKAVVKGSLINDEIKLITYIKVDCYKKFLLSNAWGEIDSFGELFCHMTGLEYNMPLVCQNITLFMFMPGLLPFFLPYLYDQENFHLRHFNYSWLEITHLFIFKNQIELVTEISKELEGKKGSREDYCEVLHKFLSKLEFSRLQKVFQVRINIQEYLFTKVPPELRYNLIEFGKLSEVSDFSIENFEQSFAFVDKLHLTKEMKSSLKSYQQRSLDRKDQAPPIMPRFTVLPRLKAGLEDPDQVFKNQNETPESEEDEPSVNTMNRSTIRDVWRSGNNNHKNAKKALLNANSFQKKESGEHKSLAPQRDDRFEFLEFLKSKAKRRFIFSKLLHSVVGESRRAEGQSEWYTLFMQLSKKMAQKIDEKGQDIAGKLNRTRSSFLQR